MPQHVLVVDQVHDLDPLDCLGPDAALIAMACGTRRRSRAIREGLAAQRRGGAEACGRRGLAASDELHAVDGVK